MIGLLTIMAIPVTISVAQGIKGDREEKAKAKLPPYFTLFSECKTSVFHDHKQVVLRDNKVIASQHSPFLYPIFRAMVTNSNQCYLNTNSSTSHCFGGYIREFINSTTRALVSTTSFDPPALGWIYVDKKTREVKYGNRGEAGEETFGPWSYDAFGLNVEDWHTFFAVEEEDGEWALYAEVKGQPPPGPDGKKKVSVRLTQEAIEELIPTKK